MDRVIHYGRIDGGEFTGKSWEIIRQHSGAPYRLEIEGEFWANADNAVELLDEVINIENRPCGERGGDIECA